jgi:putative membrane protein
MDVVLQSFATGFPVLLLHLCVTLAMLAGGVVLYTFTTPHKDFALVKSGNLAAAISLSGATLGLAIPLAFCMAASVSVGEIVIWGVLAVIIQILVFRVCDLLLRDLSTRIEAGELAPAVLLAGIKLSVAAINAAAISG